MKISISVCLWGAWKVHAPKSRFFSAFRIFFAIVAFVQLISNAFAFDSEGYDSVEAFQRRMAYVPVPSSNHLKANIILQVVCNPMVNSYFVRGKMWGGSPENYAKAAQNAIFDDMSRSGLFNRVDVGETRNDTDLIINVAISSEKPSYGVFYSTVIDPYTKETIKIYAWRTKQKFSQAMAHLRASLLTDWKDTEFAERRHAAEDARRKAVEERKLAEESRQRDILRVTDQDDSGKELFKLRPDQQFSITEVTEYLITWKNKHLDSLLRNAKTTELRDYINQIEHTVLEATDAAEKEKDTAQHLITSGAGGEESHTDLARAYRLRIEVLKPILAAIKEESANRAK